MTIKSSVYDPKKAQPSIEVDQKPLLLRNPTKTLVLAMQALFLLYQIEPRLFGTYTSGGLSDRALMIFFSAIVFVAFITDQKLIMKAHMWSSILIAALPLAFIELLVGGVIAKVIFKNDKVLYGENCVRDACAAIFLIGACLIGFAYYISKCHELIKNLENKEKAALLPYSNQDLLKGKPDHPTVKI